MHYNNYSHQTAQHFKNKPKMYSKTYAGINIISPKKDGVVVGAHNVKNIVGT